MFEATLVLPDEYRLLRQISNKVEDEELDKQYPIPMLVFQLSSSLAISLLEFIVNPIIGANSNKQIIA